jgi:capsule polysaccharide export protein KpsE/RkpR
MFELLTPVARHWRSVIALPLAVGVLAYGATWLVRPTFVSETTFMPPQQQQSAAASALASLGSLAGLGGAGAIKSPADQYVALLESVTISDRIIDRFKLREVYEVQLRELARQGLAKRMQASVGKKDGLITVHVEDWDARRAADIANAYVDELRRMTSGLAMSEAQQRRAFFERQLETTKTRLTAAQIALQDTGVNGGTLKAEPRSAVEAFARVDAQLTVAEVKLQTLRSTLTDGAYEVRQQQALVQALTEQKHSLEQSDMADIGDKGNADYVTRYREFKYQETLFDLFARQFEIARADESREGALIQVIDVAQPAERKSKPRRAIIAAGATLGAAVAYMLFLIGRSRWRASLADPAAAERYQRFRSAWRRG